MGVIAGAIWLIWVIMSATSHFKSRGTQVETGEKASKE